jgi:hypothetical protein
MTKERRFRGTNIRVRSLGSDWQTAAIQRLLTATAASSATAAAVPVAGSSTAAVVRSGPFVQRAAVRIAAEREALATLGPDDEVELSWIDRLRPRRNLIAPAEAFAQAVKRLMPAVDFNTYDEQRAKSRRAELRERQERVTEERRAQRLLPTAAMRSALDPRKLPKDNGAADLPEEQEVFDLLTGNTKRERVKARKEARRAALAVARAGKSFSDTHAKREVRAALDAKNQAKGNKGAVPTIDLRADAQAKAAQLKKKKRRGRDIVGDGL